jgi:serine phosphatase RsbU (regulator of sigma subunit)
LLDDPAEPVGTRRGIRPSISEVPLAAGLAVVVFTDGLVHAGDASGQKMDIAGLVQDLLSEGPPNPAAWADRLLGDAVSLDRGRPYDDISVVVAAILPHLGDEARRLTVRMPL